MATVARIRPIPMPLLTIIAVNTLLERFFWSIFKRGFVGTFHKVSDKYLALCVAEFQFRYNNWPNPEFSTR